MAVNLKSLIGKLNDNCRQALEGAAGVCLSRSNYNVEIEHWLLKLLEIPNTDFSAALRFYGVDESNFQAALTRAIDKLKTGNSRSPALSPDTVDLAREAWLLASVDFGSARTRSAHLLLALLSNEQLKRLISEVSPELASISADALLKELPTLMADTAESTTPTSSDTTSSATQHTGPTNTPSLDQYTIDLTEQARSGKIDPVLGRDPEIRQVVDILTRRRQNNPILTGEAGVGKTAVVEGFARRIAEGDVPPSLQNVSLRTLDLGLLQAGAGMKGEFENRLKSVIAEVQSSVQPIILFIDEAHTIIGAGGQAGQGDAANLLKPALARGELRTIAATTWSEYKQYFESDAALARRFQVVKVEEPNEEAAVVMMQGISDTLARHHNVEILDEAINECVRLSNRYISGRQLPDKSVSLLDTACARVAIGHTATPPAIEDCQRSAEHMKTAIEILEREQSAGADHSARIEQLTSDREAVLVRLNALNEQWEQEIELVGKIREHRAALMPDSVKAPKSGTEDPEAKAEPEEAPAEIDREKVLAELSEAVKTLHELQGESPLVQPAVDGQAIAEVVAGWTGIPVGRMVSDEIRTILTLKARMEERVVGQSHALEAIAQRIRTSRANLTDPRKPIGVFFLVGPSGVGKTETGLTLAQLLYGGEQNMTVINMSEFKEEHKVSLLMGSPPGYVGYGKGGVLTEAVRRRPYSVVLLDEMEKAHPGVQDIFYQVFDKGMLRDSEGRDVDFKNTVILMTSNAATDAIMNVCSDPETMPDSEALARAIHPELLKTFKPAFLGRISVVPYFPLSDEIMKKIVELQLGRVSERVSDHYDAAFEYDPAIVDSIVSRCTEVESGARNVDRILSGSMLPEMSAQVLSRLADQQGISRVRVDLNDDESFRYSFD